jgi:hypothetical protein
MTNHMKPLRTLPLLCLATSLLSGCLVVNGPNNTYQIGRDVTRTDSRGDTEKLSTQDGWISTKLPEAKIPRLTVWYISKQDSGIKAWRYGYSSEDNQRYIDPLSPIVAASNFSATGWVTYLVQGNKEKDFIVKRADFVKGGKPEVLGSLEGVRGEWRFSARNGETYAAYDYHLTSKGILLLRSASVFTYLPAQNPKAQMLPEGWSFAGTQKGDIEESRAIVVRKPDGRTLLEPTKHLIGIFDIDKGKVVETIRMNLAYKSEAESLSNRFYLFNTTKGPLTVAIEDAFKHVTVRNIKTGEKREAFERDSGIAFLQAAQANTGRIAIKAAVGFSDEVIYDAEDFLYSGNRVAPKP